MSSKKNHSPLGQKIRKARKAIDYSQRELARILKVSDKTVSAYEVGRAMPSFNKLSTISRVTKKPLSYFDTTGETQKIDIKEKINTIEKELKEIKRLLKKQHS